MSKMSTISAVDEILGSISRLPDPTQPTASPSLPSEPASRDTLLHTSPPKPNNPLDRLPLSAKEDAKSLFLTLHLLFPHDFLPALDLIDRGLTARLVSAPSSNTNTTATNTATQHPRCADENDVFYIQSASAITEHRRSHLTISTASVTSEPQSRFRNALTGKGSATQTFYEVRVDSWNCSCAAFAYSSFQGISSVGEHVSVGGDVGIGGMADEEEMGKAKEGVVEDDEGDEKDGTGRAWKFGGTTTRSDLGAGIPVCKHILAAVMVKAAPSFFGEGVNVDVRRDMVREEMAGWGAGWGDGG